MTRPVLDGTPATVPLSVDSPWTISRAGELTREGVVDVGQAAVGRPRFYDLTTADGTPYEKIARLHGRHVLATTVVQTCIRYQQDTRCRFCTIEDSLRWGATTRVKSPLEIAEVALAAVRMACASSS